MRLSFESPVGPLTLMEENGRITHLLFRAEEAADEAPVLYQARRELEEYFCGKRRTFSVPLAPQGTPFQKQCWNALLQIPYGKVCSYAQQAAMIGNPKACRAVGMANHCNPLPIFIPCHRVVGKNGSLTGYAGGLDMKRTLLLIERNEPNA